MVSSYSNNNNTNISAASSSLQQQQQQQPMTTDALIINSNSNVVSEEILLQLKEQFGDNKQIFILNSSNNSISASSHSPSSLISSATPIQYLIVDKDIDINTILQDQTLFSHVQSSMTASSTTASSLSHTVDQQHQTAHLNNGNGVQKSSMSSLSLAASNNAVGVSSSTSGGSASLIVEESINRVQVPPPKRKKFEYKLENKKNSYQDAFLRYLAGKRCLALFFAGIWKNVFSCWDTSSHIAFLSSTFYFLFK